MTKIMAVTLVPVLIVLFLINDQVTPRPSQDAKSVANDATHASLLGPQQVKQRQKDVARTSRDFERVEIREQKRRARAKARAEARAEARAQAQAQAEAEAEAATNAATRESSGGTSSQGSGSLPQLLLFIRSHESGGNYSAYNGSGCEGYGCYGAYQLHGAYMDDWARRYGAGEYAGTPANQWPASVQDKVALGLFYSTSPDGAHWCNWTDYC